MVGSDSRLLISGCSVARLSRHVWDVEAAGSNPATPTLNYLSILPTSAE